MARDVNAPLAQEPGSREWTPEASGPPKEPAPAESRAGSSTAAEGSASQNAAAQAYRSIRDLIVTLEIPPAGVIDERALSNTLDLGRTPVREAIKRLEVERLVAIFPRRGTFATDVQIIDHASIAEVRRTLEALAGERAAERAEPAEREELRALARRAREPLGDPETLMRFDSEVHRAIYRSTHNQYLAATLDQYYNHALRIWHLFLGRLGGVEEHVRAHAPLLDAIVAGDGVTARELAVEHVVAFDDAVRNAI